MRNKIAIQGFKGCFHQAAAQHFYGSDIEIVCCSNFPKLVQAAADPRLSNGGIMAIENSIAGSILPNYNLLNNSNLRITGEVYLQINQHLLVNPGVQLEEITEVHSHPMALLQCLEFLEKHNWKLIETEDTALSARNIHEQGSRHIAGIAGRLAAELFDLDILAADIHTQQYNYTRFWALQPAELCTEPDDADKASVNFQTDHSKGSLAKVLTRIAEGDVNLSKLQSMPIPGSDWKYSFHADLEFTSKSQLEAVLEKIKPFTAGIKVHGVYKNGKN